MPKDLERKLEKEYPNDPHAVYGTLNKLGMMQGNKETKKGKVAERKMEMAKKMHHKAGKHGEGHMTYISQK